MIDEYYVSRLKVDKKIINNIKEILEEKKLTMKDLTKIDSSIDYGFFKQVMQGNKQTISLEFGEKISKALGVDLAQIYGGVLTYK